MKQRVFVILALILLLIPRVALAHEFWIEARKHQVAKGEKIEAGLFNGQKFKGVEMAWFPPRIASSGWMNGPYGGGFDSGPGDRPAIHMGPDRPGLYRLIYEATPRLLTYNEWDTFVSFTEKKGHPWAIERHAARGLPETGFTESYRRFCKALVAVGDGAGADAYTGMELELVALSNPYTTPPAAGVQVELRYQGKPQPDTRITVFEKAGDGAVQITRLTSDPSGQAVIAVTPGHRYLIDAVVLREPVDLGPGESHAWESLWAALSFAVPQ